MSNKERANKTYTLLQQRKRNKERAGLYVACNGEHGQDI